MDPIEEHIQDETDAEFLYRTLATIETDPATRRSYERLAGVEGQHRARWVEHSLSHGGRQDVGSIAPSLRARTFAWVARRFGPKILVPMLRAEEAREVAAYLEIAQTSGNPGERSVAADLARESAEHAETLGEPGAEAFGEPWHARQSAGGIVRSVVYGFNDGLTANFGLIAGVLGAHADPRVTAITGIIGAIADALSMGSSGYLAAKSEQEVHAHEVAMERREIEVMPDLEKAELKARYRARGLDEAAADRLATQTIASPATALREEVRDELAIGDPDMSPLKDGVITGTATLVGALIPIAPFLFLPVAAAVVVSFAASMLSHFGVGAARSFFTGRGIFRSGFDMFLVGLGVGGAGHVIGSLIEKLL
jgi:VIT1/CCC1 family predicted Fe2+/Mn2+ transporter